MLGVRTGWAEVGSPGGATGIRSPRMETLFDLPAHPFFVHAPLVLSPLVALAAIAIAVRPAWQRRLGLPVVAASFVVLVATFLAGESGEALDELLQGTAAVREHEELADTTRVLVFGLFVVLGALVGIGRLVARRAEAPSWGRPARLGLSALTVVLAVASTVWMVRTGHSGAESHWTGVVPS